MLSDYSLNWGVSGVAKKKKKGSKKMISLEEKIKELETRKQEIERLIERLDEEIRQKLKEMLKENYREKFSLIVKRYLKSGKEYEYLCCRFYISVEERQKLRIRTHQKDVVLGKMEEKEIRELYQKYVKLKQLREEIKHIDYTINYLKSLT